MRWAFILLILFLVGTTGLFFASSEQPLIGIGWHEDRYSVEIADTEALWEKGLSGRESLCSACALLFIFPQSGEHAFWMQGMLFPLDIIWVSAGTVVHIERNVDPASTEVFRSSESADQVIEVNAGEAHSLQKGDQIEYFRGT